jgi:predicted RNase H-like nuclease (RuvC/YqgF family)
VFNSSAKEKDNYSHHRVLSTDYSNTGKREKIYDFNTLKAKFDSKKKRLKEMKANFGILYEENENLKAKVNELEKYKKSYLGKMDNFNKEENFRTMERENEFLDKIRNLENEVNCYFI